MGGGASKTGAKKPAGTVKPSMSRRATSMLLQPRETPYGACADEALEKPYDVIVIGGGPAGCAAAQKAAWLGRRALLIDDPKGVGAHELVHGHLTPTAEYTVSGHHGSTQEVCVRE